MSNVLNRTLASVLVAAAAVGGASAQAQTRAQSRGEDPTVARQRISDCYTVGQEKGVEKLPLTGVALQQDRSSRLLGCVYTAAAGEELVVTKAYDLADPRQATAYGKDAAKLKDNETKEATKLSRQGGNVDQNGNVVRDTAKEATDTVKDTKRTVDTVNQGLRSLDNLGKSLKKFGF